MIQKTKLSTGYNYTSDNKGGKQTVSAYTFDIKMNPTARNASVKLNNQPVSSQSQLWKCENEPLFNWVRQLPAMLFAELNNAYDLRFSGSDLECKIIAGIFEKETYCESVSCSINTGRYSLDTRVGWASQASAELGLSLPGKGIIGVNASVGCRTCLGDAMKKMQGIKSTLFISGGQTVYVTDDANEATTAALTYDTVYLCGSGQLRFDNSEDKCLLYRGRSEDLALFLSQLADLYVLKPFIEKCYQLLSQASANASFITKAKVEMLRSDIPHARLILSARQVEVGDTVRFSVEKFPDEKLNLRIHEPNILQNVGNNQFRAVGTGTAHLGIEYGSDRIWNGTINVYKVNRVTSIQLTPPGGTILENTDFQVGYAFNPTNAQNLSKAVWSVSPAGSLRDLGRGRFTALRKGVCTITLSVESVSKSIQISVLETAKDIQAPNEVFVKLNHGGVPVSVSALPPGSTYGSLVIDSVEPSVARWDNNRREVFAVSEGNTELDIRAVNYDGSYLATKRVTVHVLPEKDIVTMPFLPTVIAALILVAILCIQTPLVLLATTMAVIMSIVWIVRKWKYGIRQFSPGRVKYEIPAALLSIAAALSVLAYYLNTYYLY